MAISAIQTSFKIKKNVLKDLKDKIVESLGIKLRDNFGDLRPIIEQAIEEEIVKSSSRFIPTSKEAGELGVGEGGNVAVEKTETAWTALLPNSPAGVTTFSVRKSSRKNITAKFNIGTITINIDELAFFNAPLSIIETPDSDKIDQIPWMMWFIEGAKVQGSSFSNISRLKRSEVSRTGQGLMIEGGFWSFTPRSKANVGKLLERMRLNINKRLRSEGGNILRR